MMGILSDAKDATGTHNGFCFGAVASSAKASGIANELKKWCRGSLHMALAALISVVPILLYANATAAASTVRPPTRISPILINQPSGSALVQVFAASTNGRGTAPTLLGSSTVAVSSLGFFYVGSQKCSNPSQLLYTVATLPNAVAGSASSLTYMNVLGTCGSLNFFSFSSISEVTTVASVFALAPYMSFGNPAVAANSNEVPALASAFAAALSLSSIGSQSTSSLSTSDAATAAKVHSLSNLLSATIVSANSSSCDSFCMQSGMNGAAINSTAGLLQVATNPTANVAQIYGLSLLSSKYSPILTSVPSSWSLGGQPGASSPVTPTVSWPTPAAIVYGTPLSSNQLNASASVSGTFTYSPAAGSLLSAGTSALTATFTPSDGVTYTKTTSTVSLLVNQATPALSWANPPSISAGTSLSAAQLNAASNVPGNFYYSPGVGTQLTAGSYTLWATFVPSDAVNYVQGRTMANLTVTPAAAVISWPAPQPITYGTALSSAQLNATSTVPGRFFYSPGIGEVLSAGAYTLSATFVPNDTTTYSNSVKTTNMTVNPVAPAITWATPAPIPAGTSLSSAQLNATSAVPGTFTYSPAAGFTPPVGTTQLLATFTPNDSVNYVAATANVIATVASADPTVTNISIGTAAVQTGVKRLGMNLGTQTFYDSGQMLRNLVFRNPGFEAEISQFILQCKTATASSCTDQNQYATWPVNFLLGATFEDIYGNALGATGVIASSTAASYSGNIGVTINFAPLANAPAAGDVIVVKMSTPGNAQAGWWPTVQGGATITAETVDLSPKTQGHQALRATAAGSGQSVDIASYFDTYGGKSFVQMKGTYQISFRAKGAGGTNQMNVSLVRIGTSSGNETFFNQTITLAPVWQDYTFDFSASENGSQIGTVALSFGLTGANAILDDVSVTPATTSSANSTPYRDEVVSTLVALHPGILRYMEGGKDFGTSIDNMIAPPFARQRANHSTQQTEEDDVATGLHEFLQLCQAVGAEPWYTMPAGMAPSEMKSLIEYLAGDSSTPYGAIRASRGQVAPWSSVFPVIHLELGNEQWNGASFYGATITDPVAFGTRTAAVFGAARSSASYNPASFDLVLGSWAAVPYWSEKEMTSSSGYDSVAVAPYLFNNLNDYSSAEAIFGPMFAQPEMVVDSSSGYMNQQAQTLAQYTAKGSKVPQLAVYEVNLSTVNGSAPQNVINAVVPSVASGITIAEHMLLMMRDLGVKTQSAFSLAGIGNTFNSSTGASETVPLWGTVLDMGGATNTQRPVFLATQLANTAISPTMLGTTVTGNNPTWNQPLSKNDSIQLNGAHEIQSFAFSNGTQRSLILFNLSRTDALPVTVSGANAPAGSVAVSSLTSANLTDSNETSSTVSITNSGQSAFLPGQPFKLAPFSMTVLTWQSAY